MGFGATTGNGEQHIAIVTGRKNQDLYRHAFLGLSKGLLRSFLRLLPAVSIEQEICALVEDVPNGAELDAQCVLEQGLPGRILYNTNAMV